ncbi:MAG TPA: methyltransferase [Thermoanaerobaculia bacterium]|nr:methyltransferase [Thermoanaerobaculia bacterium]
MKRTSPEEFPALVPPEPPELARLFDYRFLASLEIFDELVDATAWRMLELLGAVPDAGGIDPELLAAERGLVERIRVPFRFLFQKLASSGTLRREGALFFRGETPVGSFEELALELEARSPEAAVGAEILRILLEESPAYFSGAKTGEEILFSPARLSLWFRFFSNENPLYAINNLVGAEALARAAPADGASVLEVGGGAGSAAQAALARLGPRISCYRFTELVPTFLRRGERAVRAAAPPGTSVATQRLDMTKPWGEQGIAPGSVDAVYAVNCFHVAPDLGFVLAEAARAIRPGGAVVVSECMRPTGSTRPIYMELVFDFLESFTNVSTDPERRPVHGFLTPLHWRRSFAAAGLPDVEVLPDVDTMATRYARFFVGAAIARRSG